MKKYQSFYDFLRRNIIFLILCVVINLFSGLFKSLGATYLQEITDALELGEYDLLLGFVLIGGALTFGAFVLRWLGAVVPNYLAEKFSYESRIKLFEHLTKIPFMEYEKYPQGELLSIMQNDSTRSGQILYTVLSRILNNIFLFGFSVWVMAKTHVTATIVAVCIVFAAAIINQLILKRMKRHEENAQQSLAEMTSSLERTFNGIETIKTYDATDFAVESYHQKQKEYCDSKYKSSRVNAGRVSWYLLVEDICLCGSVAYLGYMGITGLMSVGEVMMFIYLIKQIITPVEVIFRWMSTLAGSAASWERVCDKMNISVDEAAESSVVGVITDGDFAIKADDINFSYDDDEGRKIIDGLDIELKSGEIVGLTGASGTGKTTLLKILSGMYHSPTASFTLNGTDVDGLLDITAYASLDKSLFPLSIYENISMGNGSVTKSAAQETLTELGFGEWIAELPNGIDTMLNEDISGGQQQSIATARALLSGKPLIILDEPYSALDVQKEEKLSEYLASHKKGRVILLTSHRDDVFENVDSMINL